MLIVARLHALPLPLLIYFGQYGIAAGIALLALACIGEAIIEAIKAQRESERT